MHNINQSILYKLHSKSKLYSILKTDKSEIEFFFKNQNYYKFNKFTKGKDKPRLITAPKDELKRVLKNLDRFIKRIETPKYVMSSKKGTSSIDNAKIHKNSNFVITLDIASFYPSINKQKIYNFFNYRLSQSKDIAYILTKLSTTEEEGLPQGFPTSSKLAFWAYEDMFSKINQLSNRYNILFTVYVDDLTFSSKSSIPKVFDNEVKQILEHYDFTIKMEKTQRFGRQSNKHITGIVIAKNKMRMPFKKFKDLRLLINKKDESLKDSILGLISYNRSINKHN